MGWYGKGSKGPGGVLPASTGVGELLQGDGAGGWKAAAESLPSAAATNQLTPPVWDPVGKEWASNQVAWATQATWFVDSVAGNDNNDGIALATAIKTLAELTRRLNGVAFGQNTAITLTGDFSTQDLVLLDFSVATGFTLDIYLTATTIYSGTITGKTDAVAGVNEPNFTDAAIVDVAPYIDKRARLTAGASINATTFLQHKIAATQVETQQWAQGSVKVNATLDTYVIENLAPVRSVHLRLNAATGTVQIHDAEILGAYVIENETGVVRAIGCRFSGVFSYIAVGPGTNGIQASYFNGSKNFVARLLIVNSGSSLASDLLFLVPCDVGSSNCAYQGELEAYGRVAFTNDNAIQRSTNGTGLHVLYNEVVDTGTLWGVVAGADCVLIDNGGGLIYTTLPTLTTGTGKGPKIAGNVVPWANAPLRLSGASIQKSNARLPDAIEIAFNFGPAETTKAVPFPAGTTLSTTAYVVEFVELAPTGGVPAPSAGPWSSAPSATVGFTANITVAPGAGVTRNFLARVKL